MHNFAVMANNQDIKSTPCDPVIKYVLQFMEMKWSKRNPGHHFCKAWLYLAESGEKTTKLLKQFAMKYYPNEQMVDEEIAQAGKAAQLFEIEIEHMSGKEVQER